MTKKNARVLAYSVSVLLPYNAPIGTYPYSEKIRFQQQNTACFISGQQFDDGEVSTNDML